MPDHDSVLKLLFQLALLLGTARLFAYVCQRLGQPSVVGVVMAMTTSLMAPTALRSALRRRGLSVVGDGVFA